MRIIPVLTVLTLLLAGGCGGEFLLVVPDAVALPDQPAAMVARLQRREFATYFPPQQDSVLTFTVGQAALKAARTDAAGYAAVALPAPDRTGRYEVAVSHLSPRGETVDMKANLYVLPPDVALAAVDFDSLPREGPPMKQALAALQRVGQHARVIYVTRDYAARPREAHAILDRCTYPDSAILPFREGTAWYEQAPWRQTPAGGPLRAMMTRLPNLKYGLSADDDAAAAFKSAGLTVLGVRDPGASLFARHYFRSWNDVVWPGP